MKIRRKCLFVFLVTLLACSCKTTKPEPPVVVIRDPLVLQEISPLPKAVVVKAVVEYEPVYTVLKIIEVNEENGVQKYFLVKMGADRKGIAAGVSGDIAEDAEFQKLIGTYKISEVYGDFFKGKIDMLSYKIGATAYVRLKVGEKVKGSN